MKKNRKLDVLMIIVVNAIWILLSLYWCTELAKKTRIPVYFITIYFSLFFVGLNLIYFYYFKNDRNLFLTVIFGGMVGAMLGSLSFWFCELIQNDSGNIDFFNGRMKNGFFDFIESNFLFSLMMSGHFIFTFCSAFMCQLCLERWGTLNYPKRQKS